MIRSLGACHQVFCTFLTRMLPSGMLAIAEWGVGVITSSTYHLDRRCQEKETRQTRKTSSCHCWAVYCSSSTLTSRPGNCLQCQYHKSGKKKKGPTRTRETQTDDWHNLLSRVNPLDGVDLILTLQLGMTKQHG